MPGTVLDGLLRQVKALHLLFSSLSRFSFLQFVTMSDRAKREDGEELPTSRRSSSTNDSPANLVAAEDSETLNGDAREAYNVSSRADDERVAELARSFSHTAARSAGTQHDNPFHSPVPSLDPNSAEFDPRKWISALLHAFSKDPDQYPRQPLGVSWRYLGVHGFGSDTDYQKDVMNVLWRAPLIAKEWISHRQQKIQILRDFDGLVHSGEMLLVLGRPGRQACPFVPSSLLAVRLDQTDQGNPVVSPRCSKQSLARFGVSISTKSQ